ncbi:MAG: 50S ribosomal protein L4 [bacterium]|nr:50S ribosomal protein L4 [bacterium]
MTTMMPKATTFDVTGAPAGEIELPTALFGLRPNRALLHRAVLAELANARAGTHATRTKGDVRGGGRKPWRQKGTGRARAGSRRSPLWTGGGITFGPQPRDHSQKLSRQERDLALRSALSAQAQAGRIVILERLAAGGEPKTKSLAALLETVGVRPPAVIVVADTEKDMARAAANLRGARVLSVRRLAVRHLLVPCPLVITQSALAVLQEAWGS